MTWKRGDLVDGNYIKLSRGLLDWEWYTDINTTRLFIHMLLKANWKDGNFKGTTIPRGSFVSSIGKLSGETGLTDREIRTAISHLKKTGEVTSKTTNKFSVFTVVKYDLYQTTDKQNDKRQKEKGEVEMTDETKQEIEAVLMLLKNTLIRNGVSIALAGSDDTGKDDGCIMFFDTAEYCRTGKFKGISVKTMDLVR